MWSAIHKLLGCGWNPVSFADVYHEVRKSTGLTRRVLWTACATLVWTLWTTRNKFTIEGILLAQAVEGLYKLSMFRQVCKLVARSEGRGVLELKIGRIRLLYAPVREVPG